MLAYNTRSRLAGLASKPILHSRAFSKAPVLQHNHINLADALSGRNRSRWTNEIMITEGLRKMDKLAVARASASLTDKHAHDCNLLLTPSPISLVDLPIIVARSWKAEASVALEIIEHEQRLALSRAGISVSCATTVDYCGFPGCSNILRFLTIF